MEEFCPEGWTAQLTLYGSRSQLPDEAPEAEDVRVSLEWAELRRDEQGLPSIAVARRLWSATVAGALAGNG